MDVMDRSENLLNPTFLYTPLINKKYAIYSCLTEHKNQGLKMEQMFRC